MAVEMKAAILMFCMFRHASVCLLVFDELWVMCVGMKAFTYPVLYVWSVPELYISVNLKTNPLLFLG